MKWKKGDVVTIATAAVIVLVAFVAFVGWMCDHPHMGLDADRETMLIVSPHN